MKKNIRLTTLFATLAVVVAGVGLDSQKSDDSPSVAGATTWSTAFPVAQASFAPHPAAASR